MCPSAVKTTWWCRVAPEAEPPITRTKTHSGIVSPAMSAEPGLPLITPNDLGMITTGSYMISPAATPTMYLVFPHWWSQATGRAPMGQQAHPPVAPMAFNAPPLPTDNAPSFAQMPQIIQGHTYLLLVSHFYRFPERLHPSFGGGTASITDPTLPKMLDATAKCDGSSMSITQ